VLLRPSARYLALVACSSAVWLASPPGANAALPGPSVFSTGFVADSLFFVYPSAEVVPGAWYRRMADIGSGWARIGAYWGTIAPLRPPDRSAADPGYAGYQWTYLDHAVRDATTAHQRVLITLTWPPDWALGPGAVHALFDHAWDPDPTAFGQFARAVAARYSGRYPDPSTPGRRLPRVDYFQAWNEPNLPNLLEPQWTRRGRTWKPASPSIYRRLLNAAYSNIKAVQPQAVVLAAGLAPYGDRAGGLRMHPVQFLSELVCLHSPSLTREPCLEPAHFDGVDAHPYALTPTISAFNALDVSVPDFGRLTRVLGMAARRGTMLPRGRKSLWATEIDWDSQPPDAGALPLAKHAQYLELALYKLWRQGVANVFWYEVRDPGFFARSLTGSGLFFTNGAPKPATIAFRFPFVAVRAGPETVTLWGRSPRPGRVTIERRSGRLWVTLITLPTTQGGVFSAHLHLRRRAPLRAVGADAASLPY